MVNVRFIGSATDNTDIAGYYTSISVKGKPSQEWWDAHVVNLIYHCEWSPESSVYHHGAGYSVLLTCNVCGAGYWGENYASTANISEKSAQENARNHMHINGHICPNSLDY